VAGEYGEFMRERGKVLEAAKWLPIWLGLTVFLQIVNNFGHLNRGWPGAALLTAWALVSGHATTWFRASRRARREP
jgi:hypothetical protein